MKIMYLKNIKEKRINYYVNNNTRQMNGDEYEL